MSRRMCARAPIRTVWVPGVNGHREPRRIFLHLPPPVTGDEAAMGYGPQEIMRWLHAAKHRSAVAADVPKGHLAVYVGENRRRVVIPLSYLEHAAFRCLLRRVEEEIGFQHPMGGLTLPFAEDDFVAALNACSSAGRRTGSHVRPRPGN